MTLALRFEKAAYARYDGDRRKAGRYLREQAAFYARKADSKRGMKYHERWRAIYSAYASAAYAADYWLSLEEEDERNAWDDLDSAYGVDPYYGRV